MNPLRASAVTIPLERNSGDGSRSSGGGGGGGGMPHTGSALALMPLGASPEGPPGVDGVMGSSSLRSMGDGGQGPPPPQQQHW